MRELSIFIDESGSDDLRENTIWLPLFFMNKIFPSLRE